MIDENVKTRVAAELKSSEKLLWAEKPVSGVDKLTLVGLVIALVILAVFFPDVPKDVIAGWSSPSYGIFFLTAVFVFGCLWTLRSIFLPSREFYALTNERVLILRDLFPKQRASIPIDALKKVSASPQGRYHRIALFMSKMGVVNPARFEGSLGFALPFFRAEGFILNGIRHPDAFLKHLKQSRPQGASNE